MDENIKKRDRVKIALRKMEELREKLGKGGIL